MSTSANYCAADGCGEPLAGSINGLGYCLDVKHIDEVMERGLGSAREAMRAAEAARLPEETRHRGGGREE